MAFILQEERRATVVGERTPGAANPGRPYPAGPLFEVVVPNGQVRTRVSGHNWEGTGVTPDVPVPAADALATARELAMKQLASPTRTLR
jgi:C-terminal processing protease CtpA/Prc